jgi:hypothetical protein
MYSEKLMLAIETFKFSFGEEEPRVITTPTSGAGGR